MLSMKKIDRMRSLYYDDGMTMTDIARRLNCAVNSVRKYVKVDDWNPAPRIARYDFNNKIIPYETDMKMFLQKERNGHYKQRITGTRIFELLKELHPDFPCSYYLTKKHFQKVRQEFYSLNKQYIPLTHNPATAQVDFAEFYYIYKDEKLKGYLLTIAFPYSNAVYCQAYRGKSGECMLQGMKDIFAYVGGVPYEITFDNETSIVTVDSKNPQIKTPTELFLRFKNHYKFRSYFCNSYSPNEKASVEVGIKTIRMQMLSPMPEISDFAEFNKQLLAACDAALFRRRKGYFNVFVNNLFDTDKKNLSPLPEIEFDVASYKKRLCNEMGCVSVAGKHHYYLAPRFRKKIVQMKTTHDRVCFYDEFFQPLCELNRLYDPNSATCYNWGEYFKLLSVKAAALEHCAILNEFPETLREFLLDADRSTKKNYMRVMHEVYVKQGFTAAVEFATKMAGECVTEYNELKLLANSPFS